MRVYSVISCNRNVLRRRRRRANRHRFNTYYYCYYYRSPDAPGALVPRPPHETVIRVVSRTLQRRSYVIDVYHDRTTRGARYLRPVRLRRLHRLLKRPSLVVVAKHVCHPPSSWAVSVFVCTTKSQMSTTEYKNVPLLFWFKQNQLFCVLYGTNYNHILGIRDDFFFIYLIR